MPKIRARQGDVAWLTILFGTIVFELSADDLLSDATERYCGRYPWLTRLVIAAIAGHLGCVIPSRFDIFDSKNILHNWAFTHQPLVRFNRPRTRYADLATAPVAF
jgi:hypothetical protein